MKSATALLILLPISGFAQVGKPVAATNPATILAVKRIYVAPFTGGVQAEALRDLIIASLDSTKQFVLTDNEDRADAVLKGVGDDQTFTDVHDKSESTSGHASASNSSGGSYATRTASALVSMGSESESYHIKERKHEAYAAVRLCNKDGDVLWSTTQESLGAKFRGASADVAAKIARQLMLDLEKARRDGAMAR